MPLDRTVLDPAHVAPEPAVKRVAVGFRQVARHFGEVRAVDAVDLEIREGEFFAMLGPSGSGKTTCLRLIAGFEQPDRGHIEIFGAPVEGVPAYRRSVNTVRSEEHTSELQSLMRTPYAVFCLKTKNVRQLI